MEDWYGVPPRRPSSAIPWKAASPPPIVLTDSFENPLFATAQHDDTSKRRLTGLKRHSTPFPADNPLFEGRSTSQRPRSSGSIIRFAGDNNQRRTSGISAYRPGSHVHDAEQGARSTSCSSVSRACTALCQQDERPETQLIADQDSN